jgi:hypothetical protein
MFMAYRSVQFVVLSEVLDTHMSERSRHLQRQRIQLQARVGAMRDMLASRSGPESSVCGWLLHVLASCLGVLCRYFRPYICLVLGLHHVPACDVTVTCLLFDEWHACRSCCVWRQALDTHHCSRDMRARCLAAWQSRLQGYLPVSVATAVGLVLCTAAT